MLIWSVTFTSRQERDNINKFRLLQIPPGYVLPLSCFPSSTFYFWILISLIRGAIFPCFPQGPIGTIIVFRQCVSQKHGFLFLEKIQVCHKNVALELCLTNQNFLTFMAFSVIFQILSNFQKISSWHRWRTLSWSLPDSQSYVRIQSNKNMNLSESCSPENDNSLVPYPTWQLKWRCQFVEMVCLNLS